MKVDFGGYATKHDILCSDGRTIKSGAFKENDGEIVPLVWQHLRNSPENVIGHAKLENRDDGVYAYCSLNDSPAGKATKEAIRHGDIKALSIFADRLQQQGKNVLHGLIREVSVVLNGANPGAFIDNLVLGHGEDYGYGLDDPDEDTVAIIYSGAQLEHLDKEEDSVSKTGTTVGEIFDTLTEEQKNVVYYIIDEATKGGAVQHSDEGDEDDDTDDNDNDSANNNEKEEALMHHNVFEGTEKSTGPVLQHSQVETIFRDAVRLGSLKESVLQHAEEYGITDIEFLFPDAKNFTGTPAFIARRMEWVSSVMSGTTHSPFSRVKSTYADITADEARAKGYVTGAKKTDEVIKLLKRTTSPTTVYKKQKLDKDDVSDINDFDVVAWLKAEMRVMLEEELARAILIGDGRAVDSPDKINEDNMRPILKDDPLYAVHVDITEGVADPNTIDASTTVDAIIASRPKYKGSGTPTFYTTSTALTNMLLVKDKMGRRLYRTQQELASELRVANIVEVEVMEEITREDGADTYDLLGIVVNLKDYVVGADKGGKLEMFDDFDIDYNQLKYLIETRSSGALVRPYSALIIEQKRAVVGP